MKEINFYLTDKQIEELDLALCNKIIEYTKIKLETETNCNNEEVLKCESKISLINNIRTQLEVQLELIKQNVPKEKVLIKEVNDLFNLVLIGKGKEQFDCPGPNEDFIWHPIYKQIFQSDIIKNICLNYPDLNYNISNSYKHDVLALDKALREYFSK